jgi:hypothetical protein
MMAGEQRGGKTYHRFYPVSIAIVGERGQDFPVLFGLGEPVFGIIGEIIVIRACGIAAEDYYAAMDQVEQRMEIVSVPQTEPEPRENEVVIGQL